MKSDENIDRLFKTHGHQLKYSMPSDLKAKILSELEAKPTPSVSIYSWLSIGGGAVAAVFALVVSFQLGRMSTSGPGDVVVAQEVVSSHVRSLMANHLSDVISTDQHTVKPWFEGKLDFAPSVKDFAADGFALLGGRLDYIEGRPTAALVYKFNQHMINVFQHPTASAESSTPRLQSIRGYQIFSWTKNGMSFWVVSDVNAADLQKLADLLAH